MRELHRAFALAFVLLACSSSNDEEPGSGGAAGGGTDGGISGQAGNGATAGSGAVIGVGGSGTGSTGAGGTGTGSTGAGGTGTGSTGAGGTGTGGTGATGSGGGTPVVVQCQGKTYQCGDAIDNDGDGLIDWQDPDCFGPCDNNETGYKGNIPGQAAPPCKQDCYFDQDSGSGNDHCYWDHACDPNEKAPNFPPEGAACAYDANTKVNASGGPVSCVQAKTSQEKACLDFCGPLTPNGCDCFGCCNVPGAPTPVWLGSQDAGGNGTCTLKDIKDPLKCKPCTIVTGCFNDCKECELCLGKTTLPPTCFPGTGGSTGTGGTGAGGTGGGGTGGTGTGGTGGSGGTGGGCAVPQCPAGVQPCGVSCTPACGAGQYCLTGCCITVPA
ncbi:MAG: hypothetical protein R3B13_07160 [Polyangiaceae bacterium]